MSLNEIDGGNASSTYSTSIADGAFVAYTSPYPGGWIDKDPVTETSPTPINHGALQSVDDGVAAAVSGVNNVAGLFAQVPVWITEPGGGWGTGNRPATSGPVIWLSPTGDVPPTGGTIAGGAGYVPGLDILAVPEAS